ncbi:MAG: hypothetical protein IBX46_02585 [Desulfuromonadales bacterium]|nr:hypothetical protein [Desulfuromonadales bacterium]
MKKIAFSTFLIILLLSLAYLRRPDLAFHQQWILARAALLTNSDAVLVTEKPPLTFHDFYLITTTSDPATGKIVSFGFGHYIKVLNDDWGRRALSSQPVPPPR